MTVRDIKRMCFADQKVIIWEVHACAKADTLCGRGKFSKIDNDDVLNLSVGHMYTRDDGFLVLNCVEGDD